jgi:NADPH:quinone reductase-like Zn-dependent oxidoreductase
LRAYELAQLIGPRGLILNEHRREPEPGPGEILVKIKAASLNYRDLLVSQGMYPGQIRPPVIPLSDGAGEVVKIGADVGTVGIGARVMGTFYPDWISGPISEEGTALALGGSLDGVLAEYIVLPERAVIPVPPKLSFEEAATLPSAALTAWTALVDIAGIRAGYTVLVLGTGGVSLFALQFAKLHGAAVILTSSSSDKLKRAAEMGADHVLNYRETPEWDVEVLRLTGGRGVDVVIEVGGAGTLSRSLRGVRKGGTVVMIGRLAGSGSIDPLPVMRRAIRLIGINVGSRQAFLEMNRAITTCDLHPVVGRIYPFEEAIPAYLRLAGGTQFGKIVIAL